MTGGDPAGSNEGEEQRISSPLLWTTTPTGVLTVSDVARSLRLLAANRNAKRSGDVERTNEVQEIGEEEEKV